METTIHCDTGLLDLLKNSAKKDVDFLVDVLTDRGHGRVALSSSVKDLLLREKAQCEKYTAAALVHLLNEFQNFGCHSPINILHRSPLSYEEILTDVHKKLNGSGSLQKSPAEKEREIVLSLFGDEWLNVPATERFQRATEAKIIAGFYKMNSHLRFTEQGVSGLPVAASAAAFFALRIKPVTTTLSTLVVVSQSMGEAYRVTIPFVAQLAWIKMAILAAVTAKEHRPDTAPRGTPLCKARS